MTTDAKVIPTLVSRRLADGSGMDRAFTSTVARFDGSVAIAASAASTPDDVHLGLRGSGQSLYVGLADDAFVVASEPYGLIEETSRYVRMDGEATQGQTMVLRRDGAGTLAGLTRFRYSGTELPLADGEVVTATITTRDIDRAGFPHFLLKEISEAPLSFRKTLRGRVSVGDDGLLEARLGDDTLPVGLRRALADGRLRRVLVVGQGTAAVAGQAIAAALARSLPRITVTALPATELSGFGLSDDMGDTLVIAVSQSGTTTDTNRTVNLVRNRGAWVVGVVNRRNSDLAAKSPGVLYTSDGRDVEMSVASTKAFYAQVAAGWILALALADATGDADRPAADTLLRALRELPDAMTEVLASRPGIARVAHALAPPRRYWAVVGSGPDRVAAAELRIKLSELCYKSIACDATEDKKHIDLSAEPMILVCAGGLSGPNADDVAKEVAIYRAHKAAPIVIASATEAARFTAALEIIEIPAVAPELAFVLSAMVGHLFGYEAALAIDAQARPLREIRAAIEVAAGDAEPLRRLG
ncbi:MAG: SIS domain-containing protein, partial [Acidimicrobiales bacterium]